MTVPRLAPGRFALELLYRPKSLALIGADTQAGAQIIANAALAEFKGSIQSISHAVDIAASTDLAVLAVPSGAVIPAMETLAARGCYAAIVPGPADGIAEAARRTGVRVLGPHSFGIAVPGIGLNATRAHLPPPAGRLALVSQSAALCRAVIDWAGPNGVGFSHIVGIGGNADLGFGPALDWLSRDPGTGAILLDIRRLKNRRVFLSAARAAARLRPVVAIRAGGRLIDDGAGDAELAFEAALRRAGVLRVERLEDLLAAAETLSRVAPAARRGTGHRHQRHRPRPHGGRRGAARRTAPRRTGWRRSRHRPRAAGDTRTGWRRPRRRSRRHRGVGGVLVVHAPTGAADEAADRRLDRCRNEDPHCRCWSAPWARPPARCTAPPWCAPASRCSPRRNRRCAASTIWCRIAATAPPRASCRPARCWRTPPDRDASPPHVRARSARPGAGPCSRTRRWTCWPPTASRPFRPAPSPRADDAPGRRRLLGFPVVAKLRQAVRPAARPPGALALDLHDAHEAQIAARLLVARQARRERSRT